MVDHPSPHAVGDALINRSDLVSHVAAGTSLSKSDAASAVGVVFQIIADARILLKHLTHRIRRHWPRTRLTFRGERHYGRREAMDWCEDNGVDFIFGLAGNTALHGLAYDVADDLKVRRAEAGADRMRGFAAFHCAARSWRRKRRVVARLEATTRGFDARYIVTSLEGSPRRGA